MERLYNDAKDEHVATYVVYGKAADSKIYYDAEYTTQVNKVDAEDAFLKGRLVVKTASGASVALGVTSTKVLTAAMSGSPAALTATEWAFATA